MPEQGGRGAIAPGFLVGGQWGKDAYPTEAMQSKIPIIFGQTIENVPLLQKCTHFKHNLFSQAINIIPYQVLINVLHCTLLY